jgi:DNA-binding MarR family transcriptional regulator/N-acetylglutamate synthase-like GNAT family acetyltransferase
MPRRDAIPLPESTNWLTLASIGSILGGMVTESVPERRVEAVRRFNRFYTKKIGVLHEGLLQSPFSLTEARVLFELAHAQAPTATALAGELGLDPGYLSRILQQFRKSGLLSRRPSTTDRRRSLLALTEKGREAFALLDVRSRDEIRTMVGALSGAEQVRLIDAMGTIESLLGDRTVPGTPYLLRPHRPGDMGWVVHRHGVLYAREYGWDETFEALVAEIVAKFIRQFDPKAERCWIAEREGYNVGCVFLVRHSKRVAQLRLLLVEPSARGLGIGHRLVEECTAFARQVGYRKIVLWTQSLLHPARKIYAAAGYRLVREEPHHSFGHDLVGETWELTL